MHHYIVKGFIKRAAERGLIKQSGILDGIRPGLQAGREFMSENAPGVGRTLRDFGIPIGVGTTAGYAAHEHGAPWGTTVGTGLGAALMSDPRRWKEIGGILKSQGLQASGKEVMKDLGVKGGATAGLASLDYLPHMMSNASKVSDSLANTTTEVNKAVAGQGEHLNQVLGDTANSIQQGTKNFSETMRNMGDASGAVSGVAKGFQNAGKDIPEFLRTGTEAAKDVSGMARSATGGISSLGQLGGQLKDVATNPWVMGGAGALGGTYLLSKILGNLRGNHQHKKK